jgi:Domain of unknown function (DUF4266)
MADQDSLERVRGVIVLRTSILLLAMTIWPIGCTAVRPWQREYLAKQCMQARFEEDALDAEYQAKVVESTTGGGLPGDAPGGGCGCTQ